MNSDIGGKKRTTKRTQTLAVRRKLNNELRHCW